MQAGGRPCLRDDGAGEGVGLADVGATLEVATVDLADSVGLGEDEQVVITLELLRLRAVLEHFACRTTRRSAGASQLLATRLSFPCSPWRTTEVLFGELVLLDGGAHGAINNHDALLALGDDVVVDLLRVLLASLGCGEQGGSPQLSTQGGGGSNMCVSGAAYDQSTAGQATCPQSSSPRA